MLCCAVAGCSIGSIDLEGRECECIRGWVCNRTVNRCVRDVERDFAPVLVGSDVDLEHGRGELRVAEGEHWLMHTDSGAVEIHHSTDFSDERPEVLRVAGAGGVEHGIGYQLLDDRELGVFSFESLEIADGGSVVLVGRYPGVLLAVTDITVDGILSAGAERVPDTPGPGGGAGATFSRSADPPRGESPLPGGGGGSSRAAGSGASNGGCGGLGGPSEPFSPGAASAPYADDLTPDRLVGGAGGGSGGAGSDNACSGQMHPGLRGGHGGGGLAVVAGHALFVGPSGSVDARGGGGRGGVLPASAPPDSPLFDLSGGGGGGSGGTVVLEAPLLQIAGAVTANGGGGGGGSGYTGAGASFPDDFAAGMDGEDGSTTAAPAAGGAGGLGGGAGGDGGGADGCGCPGEPPAAGGVGRTGGGGGGAGVLHLRTSEDMAADVLLDTAVVSPGPASGLFVQSPLDSPLPVATPTLACRCECPPPAYEPPLMECT